MFHYQYISINFIFYHDLDPKPLLMSFISSFLIDSSGFFPQDIP